MSGLDRLSLVLVKIERWVKIAQSLVPRVHMMRRKPTARVLSFHCALVTIHHGTSDQILRSAFLIRLILGTLVNILWAAILLASKNFLCLRPKKAVWNSQIDFFPVASVTNCHRSGSLEPQKRILSHSGAQKSKVSFIGRKSEGWQGCAPSRSSRVKSVSQPLQLLMLPALLGFWPHHCFHLTWPSPHPCEAHLDNP